MTDGSHVIDVTGVNGMNDVKAGSAEKAAMDDVSVTTQARGDTKIL